MGVLARRRRRGLERVADEVVDRGAFLRRDAAPEVDQHLAGAAVEEQRVADDAPGQLGHVEGEHAEGDDDVQGADLAALKVERLLGQARVGAVRRLEALGVAGRALGERRFQAADLGDVEGRALRGDAGAVHAGEGHAVEPEAVAQGGQGRLDEGRVVALDGEGADGVLDVRRLLAHEGAHLLGEGGRLLLAVLAQLVVDVAGKERERHGHGDKHR